MSMTSGARIAEPIGQVVHQLVEQLAGARRVSEMLAVSSSQVRRWDGGDSRPSPKSQEPLRGLDQVVAHAQGLWGDRQVVVGWLLGTSAYLGWATPARHCVYAVCARYSTQSRRKEPAATPSGC